MTTETHRLLHRLWSKAVGTPDYVKQEWKDMERELIGRTGADDVVKTLSDVRAVPKAGYFTLHAQCRDRKGTRVLPFGAVPMPRAGEFVKCGSHVLGVRVVVWAEDMCTADVFLDAGSAADDVVAWGGWSWTAVVP